MSLRPDTPEKVKFILIAILLMVAVNFLMAQCEEWRMAAYYAPTQIPPPQTALAENASPVPRVVVLRNVKTIELSEPMGILGVEEFLYEEPLYEEEPPAAPVPEAKKPEKRPPLPKPSKTVRREPLAKVVIIIDDMGLTASRDRAVLDLPGPLTLAYLPYAPGVAEQARGAKARGHELLIHTPMEPINGRLDMGPIALREGMSEEEFKRELREKVFPSFEGYVGINNHMGSRLTQNPKAMGWVMQELKKRGLAFVDSVTIQASIAASVAQDYEVPFAVRDVFLDHYDSEASVHKALAQLERRAHEHGYAVAIGHPKPHTIRALQKWLPGMAERGVRLVPLSHVLERPWEREAQTASSAR